MTWTSPLPSLTLQASSGSLDYQTIPEGHTGVPHGPDHPGAFGYRRANHTHEGVDLYCPEGTEVAAVESGTVVALVPFTGQHANPPSPWWEDTWALLVEGDSGVVVYGEIQTDLDFWPQDPIQAGEIIGRVKRVLRQDKGRPMSMLHLELHEPGTQDAYEWLDERPASLLDPTGKLLEILDG